MSRVHRFTSIRSKPYGATIAGARELAETQRQEEERQQDDLDHDFLWRGWWESHKDTYLVGCLLREGVDIKEWFHRLRRDGFCMLYHFT